MKVGDRVTIEYTIEYNDHISITTVVGITPKGFIKVKNGLLFHPDGSLRSGGTLCRTTLRPTMPEDFARIEKSNLISMIRQKANFMKLHLEALRKIHTIIDGGGGYVD
jgi:hypothetical protein